MNREITCRLLNKQVISFQDIVKLKYTDWNKFFLKLKLNLKIQYESMHE